MNAGVSPLVRPLRFFVATLLWFAGLMLVWSFVGKWTTQPAAVMTHMALEAGAGDWVRRVNKAPGMIEAETRLSVEVPPAGAPGAQILPNAKAARRGELIVEVSPQHYAYGLPLFLALLFAAGGTGRLWRALAGYALLLPAQAFSITLDLLKQMAMAVAGGPSALGIATWQLNAIALGYQFGTLLLPTLAPIVVWLWLDRQFFAILIGGRAAGQGDPPAAPETADSSER